MARSFTGLEKEHIRRNLQEACKQSWKQYGSKKTSVDELCKQVGISKGAFYLFFESKEALFVKSCVLCRNKSAILHLKSSRNTKISMVFQKKIGSL